MSDDYQDGHGDGLDEGYERGSESRDDEVNALKDRIAALEAALDWSLDGADIVSEIVPASIREEIFNSGIRRIVRHEPSPTGDYTNPINIEPPCTLETEQKP